MSSENRAHAPPIDIFPLYLFVRDTQTDDEQPRPSTNDPPSV